MQSSFSCYNGGSTEEETDGKSRAPPPPRPRPSSSSFKYETLSEDGDEEEDVLSFGQRKKKFRSISDMYKQVDRASSSCYCCVGTIKEDDVKLIQLPTGFCFCN